MMCFSLLHNLVWNNATVRVRRYAHSLSVMAALVPSPMLQT